jgi:hypothetical protein
MHLTKFEVRGSQLTDEQDDCQLLLRHRLHAHFRHVSHHVDRVHAEEIIRGYRAQQLRPEYLFLRRHRRRVPDHPCHWQWMAVHHSGIGRTRQRVRDHHHEEDGSSMEGVHGWSLIVMIFCRTYYTFTMHIHFTYIHVLLRMIPHMHCYFLGYNMGMCDELWSLNRRYCLISLIRFHQSLHKKRSVDRSIGIHDPLFHFP